ncbi:MAG: TonB family protein [Azoarcus sp.]|jgi:protein TonB|nr:TonB family protein [Azoarcus sp.]
MRAKIAVWLLAAAPLLACSVNPAEPLDKPEGKPAASQPVTGADTADATAMALKLEDEIDEKTRTYNQRPRPWHKQVSSRTREYRFAKYIKEWRTKTERIAELNYPREARGKMYGSLIVTVSIRKDGTIEEVVINRPSKYPVLNEAVERIVRLGEPYAPFPPEIAEDTDVLEITDIWTFTNVPRNNRPASE